MLLSFYILSFYYCIFGSGSQGTRPSAASKDLSCTLVGRFSYILGHLAVKSSYVFQLVTATKERDHQSDPAKYL